MAIKKYLFRADEALFDTVEQIRSKLSIGTTKDALVMLINSGVAAICMHHGINIKSPEEQIITVPEPTFKVAEPEPSFKLIDAEENQEEEVSIEEG